MLRILFCISAENRAGFPEICPRRSKKPVTVFLRYMPCVLYRNAVSFSKKDHILSNDLGGGDYYEKTYQQTDKTRHRVRHYGS